MPIFWQEQICREMFDRMPYFEMDELSQGIHNT